MKRFTLAFLAFLLVATVPVLALKDDLEVPIGETARGASLSPNEKTIYVGALRDRKILAIDTKSGEVVCEANLTEINSSAYAKAVFANEKGDVFAPGSDVLEVYLLDNDLFHMDTFDISGFGISDCEGLAADKDGNIYAADRSGNGGIYKIKTSNGEPELDEKWGDTGWADIGPVRLPCLKGNSIYAVDTGSSTLYKIDVASGKVSKLASLAGGGFATAADDAGRIYVAHYNDASVAVSIWENGKVKELTRSELGITSNIGGIAVSKDGSKLYLVEEQTNIGGVLRSYKK